MSRACPRDFFIFFLNERQESTVWNKKRSRDNVLLRMKTFESFQWHISECCKRRCRVRSGSALELQMEENFCPEDFTVRISNFGIDVCLIFFLDFLIWFYLSVCLSLILLKNIGRNILITCIISTLHARQRGWKDHFQVLPKDGKTHTDSTRSRIKFQGCMSTFF